MKIASASNRRYTGYWILQIIRYRIKEINNCQASLLNLFFKLSLLLFLFLYPFRFEVIAQERELHYRGYTSFSAAISKTPFWHYANTSGLIRSGSSFNNLTGFSLEMPFREETSSLDFSAGAEVANRFSDTGHTLHFQQLYGSAQFGVFRLSAGRFYETIGMTIGKLSSGSMMLSKNATPVPKIRLDMTRFANVPFTNGIVQFRGYYSDGVLDKNRFIKQPFLHQKSFYLKFNLFDAKIIGGILQNTTWAGEDSERGKLPQSFSDYLRVVIPRPAAPGSGATSIEEKNKLGSTVGAYDVAVLYSFNRFSIQGYRMIYLDDTVSLRLRSFWDGLYGIGIKRNESNNVINTISYEFMNTIRQDSQNDYPRGRQNYYGHGVYRSGWTYYGNVLGNPLFIYDQDTQKISNNMIIAHHIGLEGSISQNINYHFNATYSRNYGVCEDQIITGRCFINSEFPAPPDLETVPRNELRRDQFSFLFQNNFMLSEHSGLMLTTSIAFDVGQYYNNRFGLLIGISWEKFKSL